MNRGPRNAGIIVLAAVLAAVIWQLRDDLAPEEERWEPGRVAVEVAPIETGPIADVRELTGTLEPQNAFTVAPKIGGGIERIHADIGDAVERNTVLIELDDDEARQEVAEAEAALLLAEAEKEQAESDAELARREFERTQVLARRDLASQSDLDTARARASAEDARVAVGAARVSEREATLGRARVRLSYTQVRATWPPEDDGEYVVGERMISRGDTVSANEPLLTLLAIDPLKAVVFAPERDYAPLERGQSATVRADALPGKDFPGEVARLAPRFDEASRQARIEVEVANPEHDLKPGMFTTVAIEVGRADDAQLVPVEALTRLDGRRGVYLVDAAGDDVRARFIPVEVGIEGDGYAEIREPALEGRVVTLGHQLLEDDGAVRIAGERSR